MRRPHSRHRRLDQLGNQLTFAGLGAGVASACIGMLRGRPLAQVMRSANDGRRFSGHGPPPTCRNRRAASRALPLRVGYRSEVSDALAVDHEDDHLGNIRGVIADALQALGDQREANHACDREGILRHIGQ